MSDMFNCGGTRPSCTTFQHVSTPERAALYLRISLDQTGDGLAIDRQRADCLRIAQQRGWTLVAEYADTCSASDARKRRPQYEQLRRDYADGVFDALICWDLDRLTRQPRELEDWCDAAERRGLVIVTANGEADLGTDGGRMYARIKAAVARAEVDRKSARQTAAAAQRSELGRPPLGVRLTGYTPRGDVVEAEAPLIKELFARFAAGDSLRSLAAWLDSTDLTPRHGGQWNPSSVRTILTNPRYAGRAVYQGAPTGQRGAWAPLVDDDTFDAVQATLSDPRRRKQHGTDRKYLGSGLYWCGTCQQRATSFSQARYYCQGCGMTRSQRQVDAYVVAVVRERLSRPDLADLLPTEQDDATKARRAEVADLRARLAQTERDYDDDLIDARRYAVKMEKLRASLATAEAAVSRSTGARAGLSVLAAADPVAAFEAAPLMLQRGVIDLLYRVELLPGTRYSRTFDPATVTITPMSDVLMPA
jgi:site-specific DNA recombinase